MNEKRVILLDADTVPHMYYKRGNLSTHRSVILIY